MASVATIFATLALSTTAERLPSLSVIRCRVHEATHALRITCDDLEISTGGLIGLGAGLVTVRSGGHVDLYLPLLLQGLFGPRRWMASLLGKAGGSATSPAKKAASRAKGSRGGRPCKDAHVL
jgi:hypothetical protein